MLYKSFLRCCCWFWCTAKPSWCYPVPALVSTRMSRSKTCFWKLSSRELKTRKRRWRKRKTKNKFTNIFTGNLRQNKISWTTTAEAATMQQDKQKECDCIFFVVFSTNFITGFPWQRVDNVTKFQLFAEQLPLLFNSLSPSPPQPCLCTRQIRTICSVLGNGFGCGSSQSESLKGTCLKTPPQNYINLPDASTPPVAEGFAVQCSLLLSLSLSFGIYLSPSLV